MTRSGPHFQLEDVRYSQRELQDVQAIRFLLTKYYYIELEVTYNTLGS